MALISFAIVGKNNEPLFMKEFRDESATDAIPEAELFGLTVSTGNTDGFSKRAKECSLRQQFILHSALDRFEELAGPPPGFGWREPGSTGTDAMWVGLLCPVEEMRVYGYMSTTKVKFLAVVEDLMPSQLIQHNVVDKEVKKLMIMIHQLYIEYTLNPFSKIGDVKISSPKFDESVLECVSQFNKAL
mmetsp:Transcript_25352/g.37435  ORF Transcript_25352/g.37435 Transcript_25352/m.37435 type:complete len:187 (+) Transcript_25352:14-574(+)|eukprot:CAMPEP_0194242824 /NCGR_PEP_ID=MMETSP0158-20130606/8244_1 /TAXON_ID=33649 /ORGANISM="Thalassionema nitzschioides, Strain L26-B" /LENGTH=186 /DNA_ID=CAMNT_0038977991 /DNA_START=27 /DNA_END=587 /DNA_ORIENTATION=+